MDKFKLYLDSIEEEYKRDKMNIILNHIENEFPELKKEIKWNEPMFTHQGTFIIGLSMAKGHISISPEIAGISKFEEEIKKVGYSYTKGLLRIRWEDEIDFNLINRMIKFNIQDKKDWNKFWR